LFAKGADIMGGYVERHQPAKPTAYECVHIRFRRFCDPSWREPTLLLIRSSASQFVLFSQPAQRGLTRNHNRTPELVKIFGFRTSQHGDREFHVAWPTSVVTFDTEANVIACET